MLKLKSTFLFKENSKWIENYCLDILMKENEKNIYAWIFVVILDEHKIIVCLKSINQVSPLDWDLHITWIS